MDRPLEWTRRELWLRKLVHPGHTLPTAAAPLAVACGLAAHDGVLRLGPALFALAAGWLIQLGGVLTDNYENLLREPDDREHPELVRAVKSGTLTLGSLRLAILACYALAFVAGLYLLHRAGLGVVAIGLASIAASWAYSAGPFPVGRHGLADPLFFLFFGVVSVAGGYYVQAAAAFGASSGSGFLPEALPFAALALGLPVGALTTNILIIDDIRDREFDAVKGKRTVAVRFGPGRSRAEFAVLLAAAYAAPLWFWLGLDLGWGSLLPWLTAPFAISTARDVFTRSRYQELLPTTPKAGRLLLAYSILLAIGIALPAGRLAHAQSGEDVVRAKCASCHARTAQKVGPSLKDIAAKYKAGPDAEAKLVAEIKASTHPKVSATEAELGAAARYVLTP